MAVAATSGVEAKDFSGILDNVDEVLQYSEVQTNLQLVVVAEMSTRQGIKEVTFEA